MPYVPSRDWLLVIAIGCTAVAIGALIDFFLKKEEVDRLHGKFLTFANFLCDTPIKQFQIKIAKAGLSLINNSILASKEFFQDLYFAVEELVYQNLQLLAPIFKFFERFRSYELELKKRQKDSNLNVSLFYSIAFISTITLLFILLTYFAEGWGVKLRDIIVAILLAAIILQPFVFWTLKKRGIEKSAFLFEIIVPSLAVSLPYSGVALIIATNYLSKGSLNTFWFAIIDNNIVCTKSSLLTIVNYPFDFITIAITYLSLRYIADKQRFFLLFATVSLIASSLLSLGLLSVLKLIESGLNIVHFHLFFIESFELFKNLCYMILEFLIKKTYSIDLNKIPDIHLLPLLLSTFIPVVLYMSFFLFFSFCKPIMWISGRFFEVIGKRQESVFKQLGFLVGVWLAAIKAVYGKT
jgi:hypothetical protein